MIIVLGSFRLPLDSPSTAALPMMEQMIAATRAEDGCILYAYSRDTVDAGLVRVAEKWSGTFAALDPFPDLTT
jgi:quinol monooxygenase YgiN